MPLNRVGYLVSSSRERWIPSVDLWAVDHFLNPRFLPSLYTLLNFFWLAVCRRASSISIYDVGLIKDLCQPQDNEKWLLDGSTAHKIARNVLENWSTAHITRRNGGFCSSREQWITSLDLWAVDHFLNPRFWPSLIRFSLSFFSRETMTASSIIKRTFWSD